MVHETVEKNLCCRFFNGAPRYPDVETRVAAIYRQDRAIEALISPETVSTPATTPLDKYKTPALCLSPSRFVCSKSDAGSATFLRTEVVSSGYSSCHAMSMRS